MNKVRIVQVAVALLVGVTLASLVSTGMMYRRVRALEQAAEPKPAAKAVPEKKSGGSSEEEFERAFARALGRGAEEDKSKEKKAEEEKEKMLPPTVAFADSGRYLPPCGARTIAVESVNAESLTGCLWRVESRNVVQLLARENGVYERSSRNADSEYTAELSGEPFGCMVALASRTNVKERCSLPVVPPDGEASNGVFLVRIARGDVPVRDWMWSWEGDHYVKDLDSYNPERFRLVCVSDLGLSVRQFEDGALVVWVTSLTTGTPVPNARVEVYSSANTLISEGTSDAQGVCRPKTLKKGRPFAVVVRSAAEDDMTFLALTDRSSVDETSPDGAAEPYLKPSECTGFLWTERGIYRHGEKIFAHLLVRDDTTKAPRPFPVVLRLVSPAGKTFAEHALLPDANGSIVDEGFSVPADQPSGSWRLVAAMPGEDGRELAERNVKIEEFAPPQVRAKVVASEGVSPTNFTFVVSAEHLYGGPAASLGCEGAVVFEDADFAPADWQGYRFGNAERGLRPSFRVVGQEVLDESGKAEFFAPLQKDSGLPKAALRVTAQGAVIEDGGRESTARGSSVLHYYPYYIGTTLSEWMRSPVGGQPEISLACVLPDGRRLGGAKELRLTLNRIESTYAYTTHWDGRSTWDCTRVSKTVAEDVRIVTATNGDTKVVLPTAGSGDYYVTIADPETDVSFGLGFYLSESADCAVRAPLSNPKKVVVRTDRAAYRVGEVPHLVIKAPFAGHAMVNVIREGERYTRILELTNATSVVALDPVKRDDSPNLDVQVSVVQGVAKSAGRLAACAYGQAVVCVRPTENEIAVRVGSLCRDARRVSVAFEAPGATAAAVTLVDEGINILTGERVPDPIAAFGAVRTSDDVLYDVFGRILPAEEDGLVANGVKTGGGFGAEMLGRVSPVGTRRFRPLALWKVVPVVNGRGGLTFDLPEFVGEVRVTVVAWSDVATGSAFELRKVTPKLVAQPDAPRFVAPCDAFDVTLPIRNTTDRETSMSYEIRANGEPVASDDDVILAGGAATSFCARVMAPVEPGELTLTYRVEGAGETHDQSILLPVRPAVAWVESAGVCPESEWKRPEGGRWSARTFDTPLGGYAAALRWLAEYRHGCLEQTCSRVFPMIAAGGVLNAVVTNSAAALEIGVRRVESMVRESDFTMWPDCNYEPWDREVSLYAAHFLVEAEKAGVKVNEDRLDRVHSFLMRWAMSSDTNVSAYAVLALARAGRPEKDRMNRLYDGRAGMTALSRARLACSFAETGDLPRAKELLKEAYEPQSVKEAAFVVMALTAVDPADPRILPLISWLDARRDRAKFSWGTTCDNAHALMAIGAYYRQNRPKAGERFVSWRKLTLPRLQDVKDENSGLFLTRRFLDADGRAVNPEGIRRGQLLYVELTVTSAVTRVVSDLVIEDLFAGAYDPVRRSLGAPAPEEAFANPVSDWLLRTDARDDRMLVYSKRFELPAGGCAQFVYPVRVSTEGEFVLPGASVEAMYNPDLRSTIAPSRVRVGQDEVK